MVLIEELATRVTNAVVNQEMHYAVQRRHRDSSTIRLSVKKRQPSCTVGKVHPLITESLSTFFAQLSRHYVAVISCAHVIFLRNSSMTTNEQYIVQHSIYKSFNHSSLHEGNRASIDRFSSF